MSNVLGGGRERPDRSVGVSSLADNTAKRSASPVSDDTGRLVVVAAASESGKAEAPTVESSATTVGADFVVLTTLGYYAASPPCQEYGASAVRTSGVHADPFGQRHRFEPGMHTEFGEHILNVRSGGRQADAHVLRDRLRAGAP